jgi:PAS domain S-box-containing protein
MNGINDGIFEYDLNNNKFYFSPNCKAMLGYADHELPNTREGLNELLHPEDYHATQETFQLYIDRKIPTYKNIFRMRHKDGTWRWILSRGVGVGSNKKRFDRLIGAHTDITEHKEREKEFERLNADLQSFTYMASHDLRAPLVNLKGFANEIEYTFNQIKPVLQQYASRLQDKEKEIVTQAFERDLPESLVFVRSAVEKMDKLTAAILDLSRVGGREYDLVPVDTNSLVKNCIDAFRYEISSHNIKVECENLPEVVTDHLSLEQIFSNVIDNAIKYRDSARVSEIKIGAKKAAGETIFYIKDNGRGIAEVDQRKVFDIFRRASNAGNVRGIGMGMPYVQAVLRKLGGRIWFQSTLGEGATFYFSIPQKQAATIKYDKAA